MIGTDLTCTECATINKIAHSMPNKRKPALTQSQSERSLAAASGREEATGPDSAMAMFFMIIFCQQIGVRAHELN